LLVTLSKRFSLMGPISGLGLALTGFLTALGVLAPVAEGQTTLTGTDRALGNWAFQSVPYREDTCQMSGTMQIRPGAQAGELACKFTSIEACTGQDAWIVEQTCAIKEYGDQIAMQSSIINFIESDAVTNTYMPDHFLLSIESRTRMTGQLISAVSAAVEFVREQENVS